MNNIRVDYSGFRQLNNEHCIRYTVSVLQEDMNNTCNKAQTDFVFPIIYRDAEYMKDTIEAEIKRLRKGDIPLDIRKFLILALENINAETFAIQFNRFVSVLVESYEGAGE